MRSSICHAYADEHTASDQSIKRQIDLANHDLGALDAKEVRSVLLYGDGHELEPFLGRGLLGDCHNGADVVRERQCATQDPRQVELLWGQSTSAVWSGGKQMHTGMPPAECSEIATTWPPKGQESANVPHRAPYSQWQHWKQMHTRLLPKMRGRNANK